MDNTAERPNSCKDCGLVFDSDKSLDVHLHYHKENLMSKWGLQAQQGSGGSGEDNNNVKKGRVAAADSSDAPQAAPQGSYYGGYQQGGHYQGENGGSAFTRIRNFAARFHPYQQAGGMAPPQQRPTSTQQCPKCGYLTDNLLEHMQTAHPPPPGQFFHFKEEAQILDLDSQKVHVYPNGQDQPPPPDLHPWDSKYYDELAEEKDKKYYEDKRYLLEENGSSGSPEFGTVSTTSVAPSPSGSDPLHPFYELPRGQDLGSGPAPKIPHHHKQSSSGASWKSNEARRPKTYNCSACNKWFTSSGHLKRHYNTTLHKNAVKQSGVMDPATLPISAHHHPPKTPPEEGGGAKGPPLGGQDYSQHTPYLQHPPSHSLPPLQEPLPHHQPPDFHHPPPPPLQDFHHYAPPYPNALPPHVSSFGNIVNNNNTIATEDFLTYPRKGFTLPSFQNQFPTVTQFEVGSSVQQFANVGGLYTHQDEEDEEEVEGTVQSGSYEGLSILPEEYLSSSPSEADSEELEACQTAYSPPTSSQEEPPGKQEEVTSSSSLPKCWDCDKTFNKVCYLTQHNKSFHAGDKPFKCPRCGKRFTQEILHMEHLLKHAGDKPHKCEVCPKQFNHKTDLRRHMCLHSGDKPFACSLCGKGFIRKDHMLKHEETHKKKPGGGAPTLRKLEEGGVALGLLKAL